MISSYRGKNFKILFDPTEKKYSIRPQELPTPPGWTETAYAGSIDTCLHFVDQKTKEYEAQRSYDKTKKIYITLSLFLRLTQFLNQIIWFSMGGKEKRPAFYDLKKDYPELQILDNHVNDIKKELDDLMSMNLELPKYHEADPFQQRISEYTCSSWRVFYLYVFGEKPADNREKCPITTALLDKIPDIQEAFFSILSPGKCIPPHYGPYAGIVRYHLALTVPKDQPPSIRLHDQLYTWEEGKSVMFDDTWNHEVLNESKEKRIVLFIDIKRKLKFPFNILNSFALNVLGSNYGKTIRKTLQWNR